MKKKPLTAKQRQKKSQRAGEIAALVMSPADKQLRAELGGYGAAQNMTPGERTERARKAANARWAKQNQVV